MNYFWYELTPRQAYNIAFGYGRRRKREFEATVFIERRLHTIILNMFAKKGQEQKPEKYWPLDMDEEVSKSKKRTAKKQEKEEESASGTLKATDFINLFARVSGNG